MTTPTNYGIDGVSPQNWKGWRQGLSATERTHDEPDADGAGGGTENGSCPA